MSTTITKQHPLWRRRYDAFKADCEGVVAVEFALIALPFFILTIGLLEVALVFVMTTTLDYGVDRASRQIRTGEAIENKVDAAAFKALVCGEMLGLLECGDKLHLDVKTLANFGAADVSMPIDDDGEFSPETNFNIGGRDSLVLVRVFYEWDLITPVISNTMSNTKDGTMVLAAATAFKNEPF